MKNLNENEVELVGSWIIKNDAAVLDGVGRRIEYLIENSLKEIAVSDDGWDKLYINPNDDAYWELTYPDSQLHGGGAPKLTRVKIEIAQLKYHF